MNSTGLAFSIYIYINLIYVSDLFLTNYSLAFNETIRLIAALPKIWDFYRSVRELD